MHWKAMTDSPYLGIWDLMNDAGEYREVVVEIEKVEAHKTPPMAGKPAVRKPLISFVGKNKPMLCNATNAKTISHLYGPNTTGWIAKKITLYADEAVSFGGTVTGGIRVRTKAPEARGRRPGPTVEVTTPGPEPVQAELGAPQREPGQDDV